MKYSAIQNYINGQFVSSSTFRTLEVISPIDGQLLSKVPMSSYEDLALGANIILGIVSKILKK